jgi:hypothetical protein
MKYDSKWIDSIEEFHDFAFSDWVLERHLSLSTYLSM